MAGAVGRDRPAVPELERVGDEPLEPEPVDLEVRGAGRRKEVHVKIVDPVRGDGQVVPRAFQWTGRPVLEDLIRPRPHGRWI